MMATRFSIIFVLNILGLLLCIEKSVSSSVRTATCDQTQYSFYLQTCCQNGFNGEHVLKTKDEKRKHRAYMLCPKNLVELCPPKSCKELLSDSPKSPSGYYRISSSNGSMINVYCDMEGINCADQEGGWTRVAYLNMTEPGAICPTGWRNVNFDNIDHPLCSKEGDEGGCSSVYYPSPTSYSKVCGQVRGYQYGTPDGIGPYLGGNPIPNLSLTIDDIYVDGVSITYGNPARKHIWTNIGALGWNDANVGSCPCHVNYQADLPPPTFIGQDYYCESANPVSGFSSTLYADDPLWDGQECGDIEAPCCINSLMPWFTKDIKEEVGDDIEVRLCRNEDIVNEDVPVDILELFVK